MRMALIILLLAVLHLAPGCERDQGKDPYERPGEDAARVQELIEKSR